MLFCIFLDVIILPFGRRLKRRQDILNAFLIGHEDDFLIENEAEGKVTKKRRKTLKKQQTLFEMITTDFFDPTHFRELWKAGRRSEFEVFCATLEWMDAALEHPVPIDRWAQLLFTLEQLPLMSSANADVRHGLMFETENINEILMKQYELAFGFARGERWYGIVVCDEQEDNERVRSGIFVGELMLISKRMLPRHRVRVNSESQEITLLDVKRDGTEMSITISYAVRGCSREPIIVQAKRLLRFIA